MNESLPTDVGDPISQSNASDFGASPTSDGNSSEFASDDGSSSLTSGTSASSSGGTPLLYFLLMIWIVWILLFVVWIPLLVSRHRRVSQWRRRIQRSESNTNSDVNENLHHQRNWKIQQHKESNWQMAMLLLLIVGSAVGLALSIFANLSCDFVELNESMTLEWRIIPEEDVDKLLLEGGDAIINTGESLELEFYSLGLWALGLSSSKSDFLGGGDGHRDACFNVSSSNIWDLGWQIQLARAASVAASVLGGLSFLYLFTGCCNPSQRGYFHYLTLPFLLATILQSLTLFLMDSSYCTSLEKPNNCELGLGAVSSITASLYFLFGTLASMTPFPPIEETFAPTNIDEEADQ